MGADVGFGVEFGLVEDDGIKSLFALDSGLESAARTPTVIIMAIIVKAIIEKDLFLIINISLKITVQGGNVSK